jgi:uroporphyrin-III C-methyltransferase/precorrin-2 dehydrogenase/sirohydrochlorin ferrochelatase
VALVAADQPRPPTLIIVGEVVRLREQLAWFSPGADPLPGV